MVNPCPKEYLNGGGAGRGETPSCLSRSVNFFIIHRISTEPKYGVKPTNFVPVWGCRRAGPGNRLKHTPRGIGSQVPVLTGGKRPINARIPVEESGNGNPSAELKNQTKRSHRKDWDLQRVFGEIFQKSRPRPTSTRNAIPMPTVG